MSTTQTESQTLNSTIVAAVQEATAQGLDTRGVWHAACDAVVTYRLANNIPFTSGEVAAILRTFDPTLVFSVPGVGSRLRDAFFAGEFLFNVETPEVAVDDWGNPEVDDWGNTLYVASDGSGTTTDAGQAASSTTQQPAEQVSRYCEGLGRTPAGVEVYCYASNYQAGEDHDFEVDIPRPGIQASVNPTTGVPDVPVAKPSTRDYTTDDAQRAAQGTQARANGYLVCTVQNTGRMNLGRPILEHYTLVTRQGLPSDATVFVWVNGSNLICRLADDPANPATVSYKVFRGRTLINLAKLGLARPAGTTVDATVDASGIHIAL